MPHFSKKISGTTNEKGEATTGYDPLNDADWLVGELNEWIFTNLWSKWSSITRRHHAAKQTAAHTFSTSLSGYGGTKGGKLIHKVLDELQLKVESLYYRNLKKTRTLICIVNFQ